MRNYLQSFLTREAFSQVVKVGLIGVANTVVSFTLFNVFRVAGINPFWSVTLAFAVTTFMSYLLNRRWTFQLDAAVSGRETLNFYLVNIAAWALTAGMLWAADAIWGPLSRLQENLAYAAAALIIILPKFASYRDLVFGRALGAEGTPVQEPRSQSSDTSPR